MLLKRPKQALPLLATMLMAVTLFSLAVGTTAFARSSSNTSLTWVQKKLAYQIHRNTTGKNGVSANVIPACPTVSCGTSVYNVTLYSNVVSEPPTSGTDVNGSWYYDGYMAYLCGPGATTVALRYWLNTDTRPGTGNNGYQTYTNPWTGVSYAWDNNYERSYLMYLATQSHPPTYYSDGEETYNSTPEDSYTRFEDLTDALNWEASGHSSSYQNFFYIIVGSSSLDLNTLRNDIVWDLGRDHVPAVVSLNDAYLPSWNGSPWRGHSHFVSIVGYDNDNGTFTYAETCDRQACGTSGAGYYTISQQQLFNGIQDDGVNGGLVW